MGVMLVGLEGYEWKCLGGVGWGGVGEYNEVAKSLIVTIRPVA